MRNVRGNSTTIVAGAVAGAVLMALMIEVVVGMETGIAGAVLMVLTIVVAAAVGWIIGRNYRIRRNNYHAYMKGYQAGLEKKTLVIQHPGCRIGHISKQSRWLRPPP